MSGPEIPGPAAGGNPLLWPASVRLFGRRESSDSVSESTAGSSSESAADSVSTLLEITDPEEKAAVEAAKGKVAAMDGNPGSSPPRRPPRKSVTG